MFGKLIELLLMDGITIKANFEITLERNKKVNGKRYPATCQFCGEEIGEYQYASGASRALAEHLKTCESKPEPEEQKSIVHYDEDEIPDWLQTSESTEEKGD